MRIFLYHINKNMLKKIDSISFTEYASEEQFYKTIKQIKHTMNVIQARTDEQLEGLQEVAYARNLKKRVYMKDLIENDQQAQQEHDDTSQRQQVPICIDSSSFDFLGLGPRLIFYYANAIMVLLAIGAVIAICSYILKYSQEIPYRCVTEYCRYKHILSNIQSFQDRKRSLYWGNLVEFIYLLIFLIGLYYIKFKATHQLINIIDNKIVSPSDFAVKIEGLDFQKLNQLYGKTNPVDSLRLFLEDLLCKKLEGKQTFYHHNLDSLTINRILIPYNIEDFEQVQLQFQTVIYKTKKLIEDNNMDVIQKRIKFLEFKDKYQQVKKKLEKERKKYATRQNDKLQTKCAFVIFETKAMQCAFLEAFQKESNYFRQLCKEVDPDEPRNILKTLLIRRAPQPESVIWEKCYQKKPIWHSWIMLIVSVLLILASFAVVAYLEATKPQEPVSLGFSIWNFIPQREVLFILIINKSIPPILLLSSRFADNHQQTQFLISLTRKILITQTLNIIFVPLCSTIVINGVKDFKGENGFISRIFDLGFTNVYFSPLLLICDPFYFIMKLLTSFKSVRRYLTKSKKAHEILDFYLQPQFNISRMYVQILTRLYFMGFYMWMEPIVVLFSLLGICLIYWVQKILLLRRYCKPKMTNSYLFDINIANTQYFLLAYAFGTFCFQTARSHHFHVDRFSMVFVSTGIFLLFKLIPFNWIESFFGLFFERVEVQEDDEYTYTTVKFKHNHTYAYYNPASIIVFYGEEFLQQKYTSEDIYNKLSEFYTQNPHKFNLKTSSRSIVETKRTE